MKDEASMKKSAEGEFKTLLKRKANNEKDEEKRGENKSEERGGVS
jgi:hypothetical protein